MRERGGDPFRVLVSTILSHQTRDEVTERVAKRLLSVYPTAKSMSRANVAEVSALIREVGLAESKARGLHETALRIAEDFRGVVPSDEKSLLSLPLVGSKTANAVRVFGFGIPAIPADIHIHRVANRLGAVSTATLEETSRALERAVPKKYWSRLNPTLVQHGQNLCGAGRPLCQACPIESSCGRVGV